MGFVHEHGLTKRLSFAIFAAAFGSAFQHGYNTGVVNAPQKFIMDWINQTSTSPESPRGMTEAQVTLIWAFSVSIFCVGGMVGGALTGLVADKFGRKGGLLLNNIFVLLAAILQGCSKLAGSYGMIIAGRFFIGLNSGLNAGLAPMYLTEISPVSLRGAVGTVYQLVITISILISQIFGLEGVLGTVELWPVLLAITAVPGILQVFTLPFCPESPKFLLINKGQERNAEKAMVWFREHSDVTTDMDEVRSEHDSEKQLEKVTVKQMLTTPPLRSPLIIAMTIMVAQQLSGINAAIFYSTSIFSNAGLSLETSQYATLGMGIMNVLMTVISMMLVEKAGRKTLLLVGLGGMAVDSILLTICLAVKGGGAWLSYVSIVLVILFVVMFATGPGSIPWFLVNELFSQSARPMAASFAVAINWAANFLVGLAFPPLQNSMGSYVFIIFVVLQLLFCFFTYKKVPETKNKTIEEVTELFRK